MADGRTCSACAGEGKTWVLCAMRRNGRGGPDEVPCRWCNGSGIDRRPQQWIRDGQVARGHRICRRESLRQVADRLGIGAVEVSAMEMGRQNPARLLKEYARG